MDIASKIDHTLLNQDATRDEIETICEEALEYNFAAVCVNPYYVAMSSEILKDSGVKVATVIGFPLGANTSATKVFEAENAIKNGADEIDMVINMGALKNKDYNIVREDIKGVVDIAKDKAVVKVILETCLLTDQEKVLACTLAREAGADYVKTSTGFSTGGATAKDILLMSDTIGEDLKIKASGGIRDYETAKTMIDAGASRIGASSSIKIVEKN